MAQRQKREKKKDKAEKMEVRGRISRHESVMIKCTGYRKDKKRTKEKK